MNYSIIKELGQGGMATVFLAEDKKFQTQVALKVLNKELAYNENIRKRFLAEARNMYRMSHPNIIKVTDLIDEGDTVAFVMEHIDGETLKEFLDRKGKLTDDEIRNIFSQMLEAVGYVHNKGLVHRDIKPSNFMIDREGKVKLLDFGIAKNTDTSSAEYTQTGTGMQMGTPMYMSPEQITETKSVTPQSDIYSLGVVLWQLVTGEKPYNTATLSNFQLQTKIVNEPLSATGSSFDGVIKKATEKDPTLRFTDCEGFKNALSNKASNSGNEKTVFVNSDEKTILNSSNEKTIVQKPELPATYTDEFGIEFILVEAGSFMMGVNSNEAEADEKENAKLVTITKNYYIGKYPVTCAQWLSICDDDPDSFCNYLKHPAEVYFYSGKIDGGYYASVMEFLETINSKSKNKYRLPNSTEWEFAARGGNKSRGYKYAGSNNVDEVAWYHANRTVTKKVEKKALWGLLTIEDEELESLGSNEVGLKKPNELGLYDMSGNVFEYCQGDSDYFVLRGGDHSNSEKYCRLSYEGKYGGWTESIYAMQNGFRLILVP